MENQKQHLANEFWSTHFSEIVDTRINEQQAIDIQFWEKLQKALEQSDIKTVHAVTYSLPAFEVSSGELYIRIVKTAKHVWDKKTDPFYQNR